MVYQLFKIGNLERLGTFLERSHREQTVNQNIRIAGAAVIALYIAEGLVHVPPVSTRITTPETSTHEAVELLVREILLCPFVTKVLSHDLLALSPDKTG